MSHTSQPDPRRLLLCTLAATTALGLGSIGRAQQRIVQRFPSSDVSFTLDPSRANQPTISVTERHANGTVTRTLNSNARRMTLSITYSTDHRPAFQTKPVPIGLEDSSQATPLARPVNPTNFVWQPAVFRSMTNTRYYRGAAEVPVLYSSRPNTATRP
jgi:hypothetical protein